MNFIEITNDKKLRNLFATNHVKDISYLDNSPDPGQADEKTDLNNPKRLHLEDGATTPDIKDLADPRNKIILLTDKKFVICYIINLIQDFLVAFSFFVALLIMKMKKIKRKIRTLSCLLLRRTHDRKLMFHKKDALDEPYVRYERLNNKDTLIMNIEQQYEHAENEFSISDYEYDFVRFDISSSYAKP
uniref:Uncharacterized protein n=1 Tax=Romanomermis culicivorax TaxID=13658 RepID=A0A915JK77_ROMCU